MKKITTAAIAITGLSMSLLAQAHGGRLDSNGGHFNKNIGKYECHTESCIPKDEGIPYESSVSKKSTKNTKSYSGSIVTSITPRLIIVKDSEVPDDSDIVKYDRKTWRHWIDIDGDCQDTRAEALIIAANGNVEFKTNKNCEVVSGNFYGVYTNTYMEKDGQLDADHVVPLKEAHITGGYKWSNDIKKEFANDPLNLIAVSLGANRSKSDKYPGKWMPTYEPYHCEYLERWITIKNKYALIIRESTVQMYKNKCE